MISSSSSSNLLTFLSLSLCPRFLIPCQLSLLSLYWKQIIFFTLSDSSQTVGKNRSIFITVRPIFSPTLTHTEIVNAFLVDSLCRENDAEHKKFISRILISSFIPLNVELYNSFFFSLNIFEFFNHWAGYTYIHINNYFKWWYNKEEVCWMMRKISEMFRESAVQFWSSPSLVYSLEIPRPFVLSLQSIKKKCFQIIKQYITYFLCG